MDVTEVRASDAERDEAAGVLREHAGRGRLNVDELAKRLELAFAAVTRGELERLLRDLPAEPETPANDGFRTHLTVFLAVNTLLVVLWLLDGAGYFWPVWPLMGWGIGIACHALGGLDRDTGRHVQRLPDPGLQAAMLDRSR